MSARGARSRKVQQKDIDKKERKTAVKGKAPEAYDPFANWRSTPSSNGSRSAGLARSASTLSHGTSQSSGSGNRQQLNSVYSNQSSTQALPSKSSMSGAASVSDHSTTGKDKAKFQANGRETMAPRGRGGGVPVKGSSTPASMPAQPRSGALVSRQPVHQKTWLDFKIWDGSQDAARPYGGFAFDEDMHHGSVLIYFKEEQLDESQPVPSIRAELNVVRNSGSTWLNNALIMGCLDDDEQNWALATTEEFVAPPQHLAYDRRMLGPTPVGGRSPPPLDIDHVSMRSQSRLASHSPQHGISGREPSPGLSRHVQGPQGDPTHEIWFTAPSDLHSVQAQRLHHVAVRNFFAILHGKPIVGADVFDMLSTLQVQIQVMYDLDSRSITSSERSVEIITNYLGRYGVDDIRNNVKNALSLLAWAEQDSVRWRQGYLECFTHLAGMIEPQTEETLEFKRLSVLTRRNLGIAAKTLQLRVMEAEERLGNFELAGLWKSNPKLTNGPVYRSYQAFRQFLTSHYGSIYGSWPPTAQSTWLNRKVVLALQNDFGSLYDYLVNRDVCWNPREERASRKWEMHHRKMDEFEADLPELGITDMLVMYDAESGYAHIPHPYPLLPRDVPNLAKEKEKKGFFSSLKKEKTRDITKDAKAHLQLSIIFSDATNIEKLDVNFNGSSLIDKFEQFELTTDLKNVTPREARLGHWVLIYGILQILSTLSVDVQGLKHTEDVRYFLCTDLKRCPEWVANGRTSHLEPSQGRSWCWQRTWDPTPLCSPPVELDGTTHYAETPAPPPPPPPRARANTQSTHRDNTPDMARSPLHSPPSSPHDFDGATLVQNDIARISEKINALSTNSRISPISRHEIARRRENDKVMAGEFKSPLANDVGMNFHHLRTEQAHRLIENEYATRPLPSPATHTEKERRQREIDIYATRPLPPPRSPLRSPVLSEAGTDLAGYPFSAADMGFPSPPGYESGVRERSASKPPQYEERRVRRERERGVYEGGQWM